MVDWTSLIGAGMLAAVGAMLGVIIVICIAIYIFTSLAWMTIGKKLRYKSPWLAWIPIANVAMMFQLGNFHWAWVFLILVPILGWIAIGVMSIIAVWRIYEKRNYPGLLSLISLLGFIPLIGWLASIASLVVLGLVAWIDRK
jgi:hypothetical protein